MLDTKTSRKVKRKPKTKIKKYELVWAYLVAHPLATPAQVAKATKVSYAYAYALKKKISTPKEVFEAEAETSTWMERQDFSAYDEAEALAEAETSSSPGPRSYSRGNILGAKLNLMLNGQ